MKRSEGYMARVQAAFLQNYEIMDANDLHHPIIFVVDMINGFIKEGALHDTAILACVNPIQSLIEDLQVRTVFIADAHPPKTREFISYPSHCVIGTSQSEIIDELSPYVEYLYKKNSTNTFTAPQFQEFLDEDIYLYDDIIITGCCSDICILQFALCLNAWLNEHNEDQKRIIIPMDCIDTYHIEKIHDATMMNEFSIANMAANGIMIVQHIESGEVNAEL